MRKLFCIISCFACADQPVINFHVNNNLNQTLQNRNDLIQDWANVLGKTNDILTDAKKDCSHFASNIVSYVCNNKKRCFIYSLISSYLGIIAMLWVLQIKINKGHWKNWKKELSLENLFSIKQRDLAQQLLLDIQLHYLNPVAPTDTTEPISKFLIDIAHEEYCLRKYLDLIAFLERLHIARFIYFKTEKAKYEEYATRINCLKGLFTLWLSEYKVSLLQEGRLQEQKQSSAVLA